MTNTQTSANCPKCGTLFRRTIGTAWCPSCLLAEGLSEASEEAGPEVEAFPAASAARTGLGRWGKYELIEEIAHGGMGVVFRARDTALNRTVALKMILSGPYASERDRKRFRAEAEAAARLDHPNIVPIYEVGEQDGRPYFAMQFMEGGVLTAVLSEPMPEREASELLVKVARAVHHAHQRAILHRDLKPGNILLDAQGEPHVSDFGLARRLDSADGLTVSGAMVGSPSFMSPEQAAGRSEQLTTASDTYSLGAVLYQLLTGRAPFEGATPLVTLEKVLRAEPTPPRTLRRDLDPDLETVCLKCLEKDPARRYASADALAEELERWLRGEPIQARRIHARERALKWARRNPGVATLATALTMVCLAALGVGAWLSYRVAEANREARQANVRLARDLYNLRWQKTEELAASGKLMDALAYLGRFLRENPGDAVAASRVLSMLGGRNFVLPVTPPLRHVGPVNSAAYNHSGTRLVSASSDGTAAVWDATSGERVAQLPHPQAVRFAEFLGASDRILTSSDDGYARVWEKPGSLLAAMRTVQTGREGVQASADGKWLAVLSETNRIQLVDAANGQPVGAPVPSLDSQARFRFSPDSRFLAVRNHAGRLAIHAVPDGAPSARVIQAPGGVVSIAFSPDSRWIALGCGVGRAAVYDVQTAALVQELAGMRNDVLTVEFSRDGRRLAAGAFTEPIRIWDTRTWELSGMPFDAVNMHVGFRFAPDSQGIVSFFQHGGAHWRDAASGRLLAEPFEHDGPIVDITFHPDSTTLVTASQDGTARVWTTRMRTPRQFKLQRAPGVWEVQWSPDQALIAATSGNHARLLDARTGEPTGAPLHHESYVYTVRFSPDGRRLATGADDATARVWSVPGGEPLTPPLRHERRVMHLAFSPDGHRLVTTSDDRTARLWELPGGTLLHTLPHDSELTQARFSSDGRRIVTATAQGTVSVWSANTGALIQGGMRHKGAAWSVEFSRDGRRVVSASSDKTAVLWDADTGRPLRVFPHPEAVGGATLSRDEQRLLTSALDGVARVWDTATGWMTSEPMRHNGNLRLALFSPDEQRVLTACEDGSSRLWDTDTGQPVSEVVSHQGITMSAQFSEDGRLVFTGSNEGTIRIWDNPPPPPPAPAWFCDLIEALAGRRFNARGDLEPVPHEDFERVRTQVLQDVSGDFYLRWARWFLVERSRVAEPEPFR